LHKVLVSYSSKNLEKLETCTLALRFITIIYHYQSSEICSIFGYLSSTLKFRALSIFL
jgi:hypothetical protein